MIAFIICLLISLVETVWFYNIVKKDGVIEEKNVMFAFIFIPAFTITMFIFFIGYMINMMIGVY